MIPFNIFGHTYGEFSEPIVWVDAQDISTYSLNGNEVTSLDNKGTLGGIMNLNGTVRFANGGFESWSNSDYITRDLGEPFLTDNSFTFLCTFDLTNYASGGSSGKWFSGLYSGNINNRLQIVEASGNIRADATANNLQYFNIEVGDISLKTLLITYNLKSKTLISLNYNGVTQTYNNVVFNIAVGSGDSDIYLMNAVFANATSTGQNNPLHEFRLYNRSMTLNQMQDLQTELNNKYTP